MITDERRILEQNIYLSLYCKGSKRVTQGLRVRGSWRPNRNCNILSLTLMAVTLCLSCSLDAQPEVQRPTLLGDVFLYCILSATSLVAKLHRDSRGPPRPGVVLPTTSRLSSSPTLLQLAVELNCLTSVLTELYNGSTPTRSLKSHV